jgi:hypothetical protein
MSLWQSTEFFNLVLKQRHLIHCSESFTSGTYRVIQKELYNFESLYKCIQRQCTVF